MAAEAGSAPLREGLSSHDFYGSRKRHVAIILKFLELFTDGVCSTRISIRNMSPARPDISTTSVSSL